MWKKNYFSFITMKKGNVQILKGRRGWYRLSPCPFLCFLLLLNLILLLLEQIVINAHVVQVDAEIRMVVS